MNRTQEIIEQAANLSRLGFNSWYIDALFKAARGLHNIAERQCNGYRAYDGGWDEKAELRDVKREERLRAIICDHFTRAEVSAGWKHQGDPRGAPIIVTDKDGAELFRVWG